ncbi:DUF4190 domain-containing protein [Peribacillus sp. B-H-3]|uniref:DUF4190 domain-containing protein n=1 Tax=Peribacillus sp. B-H-3 TaxID=3400420 RepID=UPI003B02744C
MSEIKKTNSKAIASLVLGILSLIIPFLGILLGIIGLIISFPSLKEIKNTGEGGRGMAIAGRVCSIIGIILGILSIIAIIILSLVTYNSGVTTF